MNILEVTSRTITIEIENQMPYYSSGDYSVEVNGVFYMRTNINVFTIYDLLPNTDYEIQVMDEKIHICTLSETLMLNVKDFNAIGDGISDDTIKIMAAISCVPKNGCVYIPKGTYLISSLFLKSDMTLYFEQGAKFLAKYERMDFPILPGEVQDHFFGTWEGSLVSGFASIINAIDAKNIRILGQGEIDCQASLGDWYKNHREKRIAWRGFGMYFKGCENVSVVGIHIHDTPSWNVHPFFSSHLKFLNMKITNPPAMPTTDGLDPDCTTDCLIAGCYFSVGDDCIAIKSGTYSLAKQYRKASSNIIIRNNLMEHGHGGVVFGSESSGGISNVTVEKCIFRNTDRGLRIKTRRGRGNIGSIDQIHFNNIIMSAVKTPFVINMYYNMGPAGGHEEYVWSTKFHPVDEFTPILGSFTFQNMKCDKVGYAAGVFLGLPEAKIKKLCFRNVDFSFDESIEEGYPVMIEHNFTLKNAGLYCFNVEEIQCDNVTFNHCKGETIIRKDSM
ncbi:MAG: glycoside hydrolase family 28 protein [Anaeroplasmataceae bacterium]|nr:glycoside hydrolase family 28 protein [Anaeroplasmataceae bacterium]